MVMMFVPGLFCVALVCVLFFLCFVRSLLYGTNRTSTEPDWVFVLFCFFFGRTDDVQYVGKGRCGMEGTLREEGGDVSRGSEGKFG